MKSKNRLFSLLIAGAVLFSSVGTPVFAAELEVNAEESQELVETAPDETSDIETTEPSEEPIEENEETTQEEVTQEESTENVTDNIPEDNPIENSTEEGEEDSEKTEETEQDTEKTDEEEQECIVGYKEIDTITTEYKLALESLQELFPEYIIAYTNKDNEIKIRIYDWVAIDDYDEYLGEYTFEPVINTEYAIEEDVANPILTVVVRDESDGATGLVEVEYGYEVPSVSETTSRKLLRSSGSSASYNGYEAGILPEIRHQGTEGACWAFAAMAAVETDLIKKGEATTDIDLSELQLAYFTAHDYADPTGTRTDSYSYSGSNYLDNGGNDNMASQALMNKVGAVSEAYVPYSKGSSYVPSAKNAVSNDYAEVTDVYQINIADRDLIKQAIMDHGSVSASIYASEQDESVGAPVHYSATYNSFYGTYDAVNHAVALVGWDDNFSADNFYDGCKPEGNGAWLVRNSWGLENYGKSGYFWLSYYDASLLHGGSVTAYSSTTDMYDNVFSYSSSEYTGYLRSSTNGGKITAKVEYSIPAGQSIEAVAVQTLNTNATITVSVSDGTNTASGSMTNKCIGYYTIPLESPLQISTDSTVTLTYTIQASSNESPKLPYDLNGKSLGALNHSVNTEAGFTVDRVHYTNGDAKVKLLSNNYNVETGTETPEQTLNVVSNKIYNYAGTQSQIELTEDSITTDTSALEWTVINDAVATVDENGLVTVGSTKGTTVVQGTYTVGEKTYTVNVYVSVKPYTIQYVLGDDVSYRVLYKTYYPGDAEHCQLPEQADMSRDGYKLVGWSTVENNSEYAITESTLNTTTGDLTLYPIWSAYAIKIKYYEPKSDLLSFSTTTHIVKTQIKISDVPYSLPLDGSECYTNPNNYLDSADADLPIQFWSTDAEGKHPVSQITVDYFKASKSTTVYGQYKIPTQIVLYPQYKPCYTVTFDANGGQVDAESIEVIEGRAYGDLPEPTREHFEFAGWHVNSTKGASVTEDALVQQNGNHTLVASWKPVIWIDGVESSYTYTGKGIQPDFRVYDGNTLLTNKVDYTYSYSNNVNAGTAKNPVAKLVVKGKGNYSGIYVKEYKITPKAISDSTVTVSFKSGDLYKQGKAVVKPAIIVKDNRNGKLVTLENKKQFTIAYYDVDESGVELKDELTATAGRKAVVISGIGNYEGVSEELYYRVAPANKYLNGAKLTVDISKVKCDGTDQTDNMKLSVTASGEAIDADYYTTKIEYLSMPATVLEYQYFDKIYSPGKYRVTLTGDDEHCFGTIAKTITISGGTAINKKWDNSFKAQFEYSNSDDDLRGDVKIQNYSYTYKGESLSEGTDYVVVRANGSEIGSYRDVVYGIGAYKGKLTYDYKIVGTPIAKKNAKLTFGGTGKNNNQFEYKNDAYSIEDLGIAFTYAGSELRMDKDYTVILPKDVTSVGKKRVIIQGIGAYTGKLTYDNAFEITKFDVDADQAKSEGKVLEFKLAHDSVDYVKGGVKQVPVITFNGEPLDNSYVNKNFKIEYSSNFARAKTSDEDYVTIKITPKNYYKGAAIKNENLQYTIKKTDLGTTTWTVADRVYAKKGNIYKSTPVLYDATNGKKLVAGTDYEKIKASDYTYEDGTEIGSKDIIQVGTVIKLTLTGKGSYVGKQVVQYRFVKGNLASSKTAIAKGSELSNNLDFSGQDVSIDESDFKVTIGKNVLTPSTDYVIADYTVRPNNRKVTVTIEGNGDYSGVKKYTFTMRGRLMK